MISLYEFFTNPELSRNQKIARIGGTVAGTGALSMAPKAISDYHYDKATDELKKLNLGKASDHYVSARKAADYDVWNSSTVNKIRKGVSDAKDNVQNFNILSKANGDHDTDLISKAKRIINGD